MMLRRGQPDLLLRRSAGAAVLLGCVWAVVSLAQLLAQAAEKAQAGDERPSEDRVGWVLRLNLPVDDRTEDRVSQFVRNARARADEQRVEPVLIFEFVVPPKQEKFAATSKFGDCSDLADFLSQEVDGRVTTLANVPQSIQGHAVLVVLACEQIAMSPDAEIGWAGIHEQPGIAPKVYQAYEDIANRRKRIPAPVALGLLDPAKKVLQVDTEFGREYVFAEDLEALGKRRTIQGDPQVLFEAGEPGRLTGREARQLDFIDFLASDRRDLAAMLELPSKAIREDPSLSGEWRAVRVDVKGSINAKTVDQAQRMIQDAIRQREANFVCLRLDSPGGSLADSLRLASFLSYDLDPGDVRTVAYIDNEALADASLIAFACDHVVMHPEALLGGEGDYVFSDRDVALARDTLRDTIGPRKSRSWSLPAAMIDPNVDVFRYTRLGNVKFTEYFSEEEWTEQPERDQWEQGPAVTEPGKRFQVNGEQAVDYLLAKDVAEDLAEFRELYGLEDDPALLEPGWAHLLIDVLALPGVAFVLLLVGFTAVYVELQMPGIGVAGFAALICFLLFFWSRFLGGTAGWLEVLLFLAGVGCLVLEVFVLPGFGIFGLGGGLLILASLILASQTFVLPRTPWQTAELRRTLTMIAATVVGVIAAAILVNRWLPRVPLLGGMVLQPPSGKEAEDLSRREALVHFENLLGSRGKTTTQLTPSGKARFGNQLVDVMADSEVIPQDTEIVVVEVRGNRVLVRAAEETT